MNPVESDTVGRGIDWQLASQWPLDPIWILALGTAGIACLAWFHLRPRGFGDSRGSASRRGSGGVGVAAGAGHPGHARGRQWILLAVRSGVVVLLLWMVGGWRIERYETDLADLVLLVDASRSMTLPSGESAATDDRSRWQSAVELLAAENSGLLDRLSVRYRLRPWIVGADRRSLSPEPAQAAGQLSELGPDQDASRLGDALVSAVEAQRGRSTAAIVMLTDGRVTAGMPLEQAARTAAGARLPVYIVRTGSTEPPPQVAVAELITESTAMVGDRVRVIARIRWAGTGGRPLRIRLIDQEGGRELGAETIGISAGTGSAMVALNFSATEPGMRRLRVEVKPLAGEIATEDNQAEGSVEVRDDSFRVLLVEGGPSYEFRFLKHLLERATTHDGTRPLIELTAVLQRADARYADQDRTARALPPVDAETLERLDLIILSDCDPDDLGSLLQTRIVDLVTRGGASLVVIAGPDHLPQALSGTPLERLLPVDPDQVRRPTAASEPLRWRLTPLGQSTPSLRIGEADDSWRGAPAFYWLTPVESVRPGARVLVETADANLDGRPLPVVVSQWVGNGQVWLQLTDETFRLRAGDLDAERYERYWLQLIRSLARRSQAGGDGDAALTVLGDRFPASRGVPFRVQLGTSLAAAAGGQVEIGVSGGAVGGTRVVRAEADTGGRGVYDGIIEGLDPGVYRAVLTRPMGNGDPPSDTFVVQQDQLEMAETTVAAADLSAVAAITGGRTFAVEDAAARLIASLPQGRDVRLRPLAPIPIWNHWGIALGLFGALSTEWILRRRWGSF